MNIKYLKHLVDPVTKSKLTLRSIEEVNINNEVHVKTGILICEERKVWFPIINFVPVLLIFSTPLVKSFKKKYASENHILQEYTYSDMPLLKGERRVQKMFTEEWEQLGDEEIVFNLSKEQLVKVHRTWLSLNDTDQTTKTVLNVGCGYGNETQVLSKLHPNATIIGMDLNLSLLKSAEKYNKNPNTFYIIASLFNLPIADKSVDHVHCQGVLMHTHDTKLGFDTISAAVSEKGSIFIWIYAMEDGLPGIGFFGVLRYALRLFNRKITRRIINWSPKIIRALIIKVMAVFAHPILKKMSGKDDWKMKNTIHNLRDSFTPPYIRKHGFNEVTIWFQEHGYFPLITNAGRMRHYAKTESAGVGMLGKRSDFYKNIVERGNEFDRNQQA